MGEMDVRYAPLFVHISEISLSKPYSRIIISSDRRINLQEVFAGPEPQKTSANPPDESAQKVAATTVEKSRKEGTKTVQQRNIRIDKITMQGGRWNSFSRWAGDTVSKNNPALRRNSGKHSNIDDSVRWRFSIHSGVDAQRMDGDSGVAGVSGVSARTGRRGEDTETVGAAQARSQGF